MFDNQKVLAEPRSTIVTAVVPGVRRRIAVAFECVADYSRATDKAVAVVGITEPALMESPAVHAPALPS